MFSKKIAILALGIFSLASVAAPASANTLQTIQQRGKIIIGVDIAAPPYGMIDKDAKQTGFDIDAAHSLAKDLGVQLEVVPVTGPTRVQFLLTNKVDAIMASFSITPERKKVIDFSEPYAVVPIVVGGPKADNVTSAKDLAGKTIAVTRGTTQDQAVTRSTKDVPNVTIVRYEDDSTTATAVLTGQQDYLFAASSVLPVIHEKDPKRDVHYKYTAVSFPMGVGLRQADVQLKEKVNEWVAKNLKNGTLNETYKKYFFGQSLPAEMLK